MSKSQKGSKKRSYTMEEKFYVAELKAAGKSNHKIASESRFPRSTVIRMIERDDTIRTAINEGKQIETKRLRLQKFPQLEQKIMEWYRTVRRTAPITGDLLQVSFLVKILKKKLLHLYQFIQLF